MTGCGPTQPTVKYALRVKRPEREDPDPPLKREHVSITWPPIDQGTEREHTSIRWSPIDRRTVD